MNTVYILSANRLKQDSVLCDNVDDKYILPVIKESQEIDLVDVIGQKLLFKVYDLISTGGINLDTNIAYKELVDNYIIPFLVFATLSNLVIPLQFKMRNEGVIQTIDNQTTHSSEYNDKYTKQYYTDRENRYGLRMKKYLDCNSKLYPEYKPCCEKTGKLKIGIVL